MGTAWSHWASPGSVPFEFEESQFDPMFGFEETGRKERSKFYVCNKNSFLLNLYLIRGNF